MKPCRFGFKTSDGGCVLDGKPCEEDCNSIVEIDESPRTVKDVLLERWAKDTEAMAGETISCFYDGYHESYDFPNGTRSYNEKEAIKLYIAYLNSAAEVGK